MLIKANQLHLESVSIAGKLEKSLDSLSQQANAAEKIRLDSLVQLVEVWADPLLRFLACHH